jgi:putative peptide zinc metalloprotease protein
MDAVTGTLMIDDLLYSDYWYLVENLKPRLAPHARFQRQKYRGNVAYILQDPISGQFLRLNYPAYVLVTRLDGKKTMGDIWQEAGTDLKNELPHQREVLQLLIQLRNAGLLHGDLQTDVGTLSKIISSDQRKKAFQNVKNPLGIRIPIWDPNRFLDATSKYVNPIFSKTGAFIWLVLVALGLITAAQNYDSLTLNISDRVLSGNSLLMIAILYPLIKSIHELGHAYAVKKWGGEVHEIGIMLIVFFPVPYVDATASWEFRDKRKRALVAAMGVIVELLISALCIMVWASAEPGLLRAIAYTAAFTAGVSTLLFNGNPLLRFDGYYVFSDLVEMPNLGPKSTRHLQYLFQYYVLNNTQAVPVALDKSEARLFFFYGIASLLYRLMVMVVILTLVATKFFFLGVMMACWAGVQMFLKPLWKGILFLAISPSLLNNRGQVFQRAALFVGVLLIALFMVPLPSSVKLEGVVWAPDDARILAGTNGTVATVLAKPGQKLSAGDQVLELYDPLLPARIEVIRAEIAELRQRYSALRVSNRVDANVVRERLKYSLAELDRERERLKSSMAKSSLEGTLVLPRFEDLVGRYMNKGELLGYVTQNVTPVIRFVVEQDMSDKVAERDGSVEIRFSHDIETIYSATIIRHTPTAVKDIPSGTLTTLGGGDISLDPSIADKPTALVPVFLYDAKLTRPMDEAYLGQRAYVRVDLGWEPLAFRLYRAVRLAFLRQFDV